MGSAPTRSEHESLHFIAPVPRLDRGAAKWRTDLALVEDLGYDFAAISEHYSRGWAMEPLTALAFALAHTTRLRLLPLVLNSDLHHPAMLAKAIATADVLSDGRAALGLGAGWLVDDYQALGVAFAPASTRIARLEEALGIIRSYFVDEVVNATETSYGVSGLEALPRPCTPEGPPILVGAGGTRMLEVAGRLADIVGVHVRLGAGGFDAEAARELSAPRLAEKIHTVREAARGAGRPTPGLQFTPAVVVIDGIATTTPRPGFTDYIAAHPDLFADTPAVLVGDVEKVADDALRWQGELGISYWHLGADVTTAGRVVAKLGG